jgi:hypothetical protein
MSIISSERIVGGFLNSSSQTMPMMLLEKLEQLEINIFALNKQIIS